MKELFDFIKKRIEDKIPTSEKIRTVELWNNQVAAQEERKQTAFRYNAVFIEFDILETRSIGHGIKDREMIVRFYFALKEYRRDKSKNLNFFETFDSWFEGVANASCAPYFSSLRQTNLDLDEDHDAVALPFVEYTTIYRDYSGYIFGRFKEKGSVSLAPSSEIDN